MAGARASWRSFGLGNWFGNAITRSLKRVVEAQRRTPRKIFVVRKVGAPVCTAAFLAAQGSDHDHQTNHRGIACGMLRDRKRIEGAGSRAQAFAVTQHA